MNHPWGLSTQKCKTYGDFGLQSKKQRNTNTYIIDLAFVNVSGFAVSCVQLSRNWSSYILVSFTPDKMHVAHYWYKHTLLLKNNVNDSQTSLYSRLS